MANPNFRPIYVPLALYDRIEHIRRQIIEVRLRRNDTPHVPLRRVIELALKYAELEAKLESNIERLATSRRTAEPTVA